MEENNLFREFLFFAAIFLITTFVAIFIFITLDIFELTYFKRSVISIVLAFFIVFAFFIISTAKYMEQALTERF